MAELVNEVKFDFSGAAMLAGHLQRAQRYSGLISKDMQDAMKAARDSRQSLIQSRIPGGLAGSGHPAGVAGGSAAGQFAAMAGAAAGGSAFFYRSTALANPAATQRFHDALDDMAAVIGHQLVPALREMTHLVRQFGDWLANHPTASKAIGYGTIGLTGLALAGTGFSVGRSAYGGIRAGMGLVGRAFGYGGSAAGTAGAMSRGEQAAAAVQGMRSEAELIEAARNARGRAATGEIGAASEVAAAEGELKAIQAAKAMPAVARASRLSRIGGLLGKASGPLAIGLTALDIASSDTSTEAASKTGANLFGGIFGDVGGVGRAYERNVGPKTRGILDRPFFQFNLGLEKIGLKDKGSTKAEWVANHPEWAAAHPEEAAAIAASSNTTATNTTELLQIARNNGNGSDRGTNR
jgi:hypothetical protein